MYLKSGRLNGSSCQHFLISKAKLLFVSFGILGRTFYSNSNFFMPSSSRSSKGIIPVSNSQRITPKLYVSKAIDSSMLFSLDYYHNSGADH